MAAAGYRSKILDAAARRRGLGSFGDLGPGALATGEWQALGLELPDMAALRSWRLARLREKLAERDCASIVLTDPINVRYATDAANMQVWCLHNPVRYAFVATEGPIVVFDFHGCAHLSAHLDLVDEVRPGRGWYFFKSGARVDEHAEGWAAEIADLVRAHGGGNRRLRSTAPTAKALPRSRRTGSACILVRRSWSWHARSRAPTRSGPCAARSPHARRRWR
jgi:Xaa-Pro dipeptidase